MSSPARTSMLAPPSMRSCMFPAATKCVAMICRGAARNGLQSCAEILPLMHQGAVNSASRKTPPDSRITRNTSESASNNGQPSFPESGAGNQAYRSFTA
ncbi:hypothetical protein D9M71_230600 [compost metagenome]